MILRRSLEVLPAINTSELYTETHDNDTDIIATNLEDFDALYKDMTGRKYPLGKYVANLFESIELDPSTEEHSSRVASLALYIGKESLRSQSIGHLEIATAGLLHDVGKSGKREIIDKPARLSASELTIINRHPLDGAKILLENPLPRLVDKSGQLSNIAVSVALGHHIHKYPTQKEIADNGLGRFLENLRSGSTETARLNKLISFTDIFDAIWFPRSYQTTINGEIKQLPDVKLTLGAVISELTCYSEKPLPVTAASLIRIASQRVQNIESQLESARKQLTPQVARVAA